MRNDLTSLLTTTAALLLLTAPAAFAAAIDCSKLESFSDKQSFQIIKPDLQNCINRGYSAPTKWVPAEGKGTGISAGGSGGASYGAVKAPESPPGSRNENGSASGAAIQQSCNFPPRTIGSLLGTGSCLDFANKLFEGMKDQPATTTTPTSPISASDTCPIDSNTTGAYGLKKDAVGSVALDCGGMVPTAGAADMATTAGATNLATTTAGSYLLWTYRKSGAAFAPVKVAVPLPTYLCGKTDGYGLPVKTVDLPPPTEQMIAYKPGDGTLVIRLQSRSSMPATFIPPYTTGEAEKFLVLPLDAAGNPSVPPNCAPESYYKVVPALKQDIVIRGAVVDGSDCASIVPTMVNTPVCSKALQSPPCGGGKGSPVSFWSSICNPSDPAPLYLARLLPTAGKCPADLGSCSSTPPTPELNCDTVNMQITSPAACAGKQQFMALNRPNIYYPPGTTASFTPITGRTQVMATTVTGTKIYLQNSASVLIQSTAPTMVLNEGGSIVLPNGDRLLLNAPATLNPASGSVTLTKGGQLVSGGGSQLAVYPDGATIPITGGAPFEVHVGRSITLPPGYILPTIPKVGSQNPYVQLPANPPV